jgi:hypothetical protein
MKLGTLYLHPNMHNAEKITENKGSSKDITTGKHIHRTACGEKLKSNVAKT